MSFESGIQTYYNGYDFKQRFNSMNEIYRNTGTCAKRVSFSMKWMNGLMLMIQASREVMK